MLLKEGGPMMLDNKDAYRILGVREGASKEVISKRYDILLRRYRAKGVDPSDFEGTFPPIEQINGAYDVLMGYKTVDEANKKDGSKKTDYTFKEKIGNFFYYYKIHLIIAAVIIIAGFFFYKDYASQPKVNLNVAVVGRFTYEREDSFKKEIESKYPELGLVNITLVPTQMIKDPNNNNKQYEVPIDNDLYTKVTTDLSTGDIDVFILDKHFFSIMSSEEAFSSLDKVKDQLNIDINKNKDFAVIPVGQKVKSLYGVDIASSSMLKDAGIKGTEKVAAIGYKEENFNKAVKFLKLLMK
jgi:hypothetical protein